MNKNNTIWIVEGKYKGENWKAINRHWHFYTRESARECVNERKNNYKYLLSYSKNKKDWVKTDIKYRVVKFVRLGMIIRV